MKISKQLKAWRGVTKSKPRGKFSQAEASARLGVNTRTYQGWESGRFGPQGLALETVLERLK